MNTTYITELPDYRGGHGAHSITMREYFAAKAMAGILANAYWGENGPAESYPAESYEVAKAAYAFADAMLAAGE